MSSIAEFSHTITRAGAPEFWLCTVLALSVALAASWGAFVFLNRKRVIEDTPTALIRSASQGYIELQGHAELMDGDEIQAPLSMRRCVWYRYKVEKRETHHRNGRRESRWETIEQGVSDDLFYLVDATGRCAVDPDGAAITPANINVWYGTSRIPGRYHESDGVWWARALGRLGQPFRYTERRIEPGDEIYALGNFTTHGGAATPFDGSGAVGEKMREWKQDQAFMLKHFDSDGDGQIDLKEWDAARDRAAQEVAAERDQVGEPPPVDVLARSGDRRRPFVIHAGTEEQIIARCRLFSTVLLSLAAPTAVVTLWALGVRLGGG